MDGGRCYVRSSVSLLPRKVIGINLYRQYFPLTVAAEKCTVFPKPHGLALGVQVLRIVGDKSHVAPYREAEIAVRYFHVFFSGGSEPFFHTCAEFFPARIVAEAAVGVVVRQVRLGALDVVGRPFFKITGMVSHAFLIAYLLDGYLVGGLGKGVPTEE